MNLFIFIMNFKSQLLIVKTESHVPITTIVNVNCIKINISLLFSLSLCLSLSLGKLLKTQFSVAQK